jgi:hypothetical protein
VFFCVSSCFLFFFFLLLAVAKSWLVASCSAFSGAPKTKSPGRFMSFFFSSPFPSFTLFSLMAATRSMLRRRCISFHNISEGHRKGLDSREAGMPASGICIREVVYLTVFALRITVTKA